MKDRISRWWMARSRREQGLLGVMIALLIAVVGWLGIIRPLESAIDEARTAQWEAATQQLRVRTEAAAFALPARQPAEGAAGLVSRLAGEAGFVPTRLDGLSDWRVMFALQAAKPAALRAFFRLLDREGVFVESVTLRANSDATVSVDAILKAKRP